MKFSKNKWIILCVCMLAILGAGAFRIYGSAFMPDTHCTDTAGPSNVSMLTTAKEYFARADKEFDQGNCRQAITDYSKAIELNPNYAEAYNNRAYTNMRMQNYKDALPDLDKAIKLRPDYINAHMNRGDIYNFYYNIDRNKAIADYNKVIALGGTHETSVCGHRAMAQNNNFLPLAFLQLIVNTNC